MKPHQFPPFFYFFFLFFKFFSPSSPPQFIEICKIKMEQCKDEKYLQVATDCRLKGIFLKITFLIL